MSGYVGAEVIRFYGVSTSGVHFLRKPFQTDEFVHRVEDVLKSSAPLRCLDPGSAQRQTERESHKSDIDPLRVKA